MHPIRLVIVLVALIAGRRPGDFPGRAAALSLSMPSAAVQGRSGGAPTSTESYMKGTETFNAELVWNALSDEAQGRYRSRGGSMQALQSQMDQAKQAGRAVRPGHLYWWPVVP